MSTESPQDATSKTRKQRLYRQALEGAVRNADNPVSQCFAGYLPVLFVLAGLGARTLAGPVLALVLVASAVSVGTLLVGLRRLALGKSRGSIDWDGEEPYEQAVRAETSAQALGVLDETATWIRKLGYRTHLFRMECLCDKDDAECACRHRWIAGVAPFPGTGRAVLLVGDRLLNDEPKILQFVMAHERTHIAPLMFWTHRVRTVVATLGATIAGILTSGITVWAAAVALLVVHVMWGWAIELACDARAARRHGDVAPQFWAIYGEAKTRSRRAVRSVWRRGLWLVARMVPSHPPVPLRAWLCRVLYSNAVRRTPRVE
ncbi:hypothetical protein AB0K60_37130 [Thermopolyspora sp. NPDC052614]|uniref:hypothetical protein n=1 Tax=Thermopolyspora sp. NPDC052614 TaxID=3155682 RepID=UPI0034468267